MVKVLWTKEEDRLLRRDYGDLTYADIGRNTGRTWSAVRNRARYIGLTGGSNLGRKYSANTEFFSEPNVINSYWAGLIAADGSVSSTRNRLSIGLGKKDAGQLDLLCLDLDYTGGVKIYSDRASLCISSKQIVLDLERHFSITPRKSTTLKPPKIERADLVKAFICGLIDGDGSIATKPRIIIYGTKWILEWVRSYFQSWTSESRYRRSEVRKLHGRHLHVYGVSTRRAIEVGLALLSVEVPRLQRKWLKLIEVCRLFEEDRHSREMAA